MVLSNPAMWFAIFSTWATGAVFARLYLKKRVEKNSKKQPVPIRVRSRNRRNY
jgi:hypothetical protein